MFAAASVTYSYDGTFDGFLCCVFESYTKQEIPAAIEGPLSSRLPLLEVRTIETETQNAARVLRSVQPKMGREALHFIRSCFLTKLEEKEIALLYFFRMGYRFGKNVMHMRTDQMLYPLFQAYRHLERESHLLKGFIRFQETDGILTAKIQPKNQVLPMLAAHFCERYPNERFLIYDETHRMALVYRPYEANLIALEAEFFPQGDALEIETQALWRLFYETIEIKERRNPRCRMSQMPKRYWRNMTEFQQDFSGDVLRKEVCRGTKQGILKPEEAEK